MEQTIGTDAGRWLKRRDAWMRLLVGSLDVTRNGKLVGVYVALRMSAKRPFTYPAMKSMARDLNISTRQVARALKELEIEEFVRVRRSPGKTSSYSLNL
jgi:DNA-binding MarR family transcriptional regulator